MQLETRLGVAFRDRTLLDLALVHSSQVHETQAARTASNERLEFLGDAILGMVIAEALYHERPDAGEGELTATRSALVRGKTLAGVARSLDLGTFLQFGRGEATSGGRDKDRNLAGALEAVVAAVYLDQGYDTVRAFVLRHLQPALQAAGSHAANPNCKAMLQEYLQANNQPVPRYRVVSVTGPVHEREFTVEALLRDTILGHGTGRSKRAAETAAACAALTQLHKEED
jgi:ribonuclease-3